MAFVSRGWFGYVTLVDNGGNETTKRYELQATDDTEAGTAMTAILAALGGVTDSLLLDYSYGEKFAQDSGSYPGVGVQIENLALIQTDIAGDIAKTATYTIPAPKTVVFLGTSGPNANVVNVAGAAVLAYQALFMTGGSSYISDHEIAATIQKGKRIHRASNRG